MLRENAADQARIAGIQNEIETRTSLSDEASFDALVANDEAVQALRSKLVIAEGVEKSSARKLSAAQAVLEDLKLDAEHAAEEKRVATESQTLARDFQLHANALVAIISNLEASRARTETFNERRKGRPGIADAEFRLRASLGGGRSAITDTHKIWADKNGEFVHQKIWDAGHGRYVDNPAAVKVVERTQIVHPAVEPYLQMPPRLADCIKLVDLAGQQIWPPR